MEATQRVPAPRGGNHRFARPTAPVAREACCQVRPKPRRWRSPASESGECWRITGRVSFSDARSAPSFANPVRLGHRVAHPITGLHRRRRILHRPARRTASRHRTVGVPPSLNFWIRIFAVAFGMGVVTGIVMPFQFGTNWSGLSDTAGNIVGPSLAYEGLTAFFLEAAFLGVLLFGRTLVPPWAHFIAAAMVALGALFSSFWILAANSWMQTPVGYTIVNGRFYPMDWLQIIFSPSFPYIRPHCCCLLCNHRVRRARRRSLYDQARPVSGRGAGYDDDSPIAADRARAVANVYRRSAWPQHPPVSAGQARRDRGTLEHRFRTAARLCSRCPIRAASETIMRSRCPISAV